MQFMDGQIHNKEKWKQAHLIFSISWLLIFNFELVTAKHSDGVIVVESDYQALKALKHELVDFRGVLNSWNGTSSRVCSSWTGIKCLNGKVIAIQLPWKGLGGRISDKIGQLKALRRLSLHDNALVGPVPVSLGFLPNLRGVYLFNNRLSGSIPPSLGNCPVLQNLDLSNNQLTGFIPSSLANSTRLLRLNLSYNRISGEIPVSIAQSPFLIFLALQYNNLSGSIPDAFKSLNHSYQLKSLVLDHNLLSGKLPSSLRNLSLLEELNLNHNQIIGNISDELSSLQHLSSLDVSYNNLSGSVPSLLAKRFNSSSFIGNIQLCGYSISTPCPEPENLPSPSQGAVSLKHHHRRLSRKDIIIISAVALLLILLILCCVLFCCLIRKKVASKGKSGKTGGLVPIGAKAAEVESGSETGGKLVHFDGPFVFTADDLLCATAEIMGKSSYGTAYKATLEDNNQVAVKRLREKITKGVKEFETEVTQLGKIRHPNILALRAYYLGPKGEKLLVYDYLPNGSLSSFLHARGPETSIPWPTRLAIAIGTTRGICYLHSEQNIVHGDLTSSNIFLDKQNNSNIAEVGLSRLMTTAANTDAIATAGTMGYRAPELLKLKKATTKSDVFSLGVIILELLTGKSPSETTDGLDLPLWVASIVKEEWTNEVFDVELMRDAPDIGDELLNTLKLALHCVDPTPGARPEAQQVLEKLEELREEKNVSDDVAVAVTEKGE